MFKSKKIILVVVVILVGIAVFLLVIGRKKTSSVPEPEVKQKVPTLPFSEDFGGLVVDDSSNKEEVKSAYESFVDQAPSDKVGQEGFKQFRLMDENKKSVSLDNFSKTTDIKVNQNIYDILNNKDFSFFYCPAGDGRGSYGIILNVKLFKSFPDLYEKEIAWMKEWEKTMFQDTHSVIFPDIDFSQSELNQTVKFQDGKYRYADIILPGGLKGSINYNIVFDSIIITSSLECLEKVSAACETIEP